MAAFPPEQRIWWHEKVARGELVWIAVAFAWGLVMFFMMIYWHLEGKQNLSNEAYKIDPETYLAKAEAMADKYTVGEEGDSGIPIVRPPPGADIYLVARLWEWWPVFELEKDQSYRLHLSSLDWQHGFSLQPTNINVQVHPNYELVMTITPDKEGVYSIVCNEYCGIGHHTMLGRLRVVDGAKGG